MDIERMKGFSGIDLSNIQLPPKEAAKKSLAQCLIQSASKEKISDEEFQLFVKLIISIQKIIHTHLVDNGFIKFGKMKDLLNYVEEKRLDPDSTGYSYTCKGCEILMHYVNNTNINFANIKYLHKYDEDMKTEIIESFDYFMQIRTLIEIFPKELLDELFCILEISNEKKDIVNYVEGLKFILTLLKQIIEVHLETKILELPSSTTQLLQLPVGSNGSDKSLEASAA